MHRLGFRCHPVFFSHNPAAVEAWVLILFRASCVARRPTGLTQFLCRTSSPVHTSSCLPGSGRFCGLSATALCFRHCEMTRQSKVVPLFGLQIPNVAVNLSGGSAELPRSPFPVTGSSLTSAAFLGFCIRGAARHLKMLPHFHK